jgi:hypothetical protein
MNKIVEIIPDNLPDWAITAMEDGQLFSVALERIAMLECPRTNEAADAFWRVWRENEETHKHGYYESTWMAVDAALQEQQ